MIWISAFIAILIINTIPVFMPPTWLTLSIFAFYYHMTNSRLILLAFIAAIAATTGRIILAEFSHTIIRNKWLSESSRKNIDDIKEHITNKKAEVFSLFLFYAFSPFPSGQLFISYGLTQMPISMLAIPFFIGRLISYIFWSLTSSEISQRLAIENFKSGAFFSVYFILAQFGTIFMVWLFTKIDWHFLFTEKKLRLTLKKNSEKTEQILK